MVITRGRGECGTKGGGHGGRGHEGRCIDSPMDLNQTLMMIMVSCSNILRDIGDWLGNIYLTTTRPNLSFVAGLLVKLCGIVTLIVEMLSYTFLDMSKRLLNKDYYMRIRKITKFLDIVMLIG